MAIDVEHLDFTTDRGVLVLVTIPGSKTDQDGAGDTIPLHRGAHPALCPVRALRAWLDAGGLTAGAVFRRMHRGERLGARLSAQSVALIVKRRAPAVGLRRGDAQSTADCGLLDRRHPERDARR